MRLRRIIIFSDLDSTLLDHETYSFEAARPALEFLSDEGIPLIFCTSKTRRETEYWREKMDNHHPFIVENGGAIYLPSGYFPFPIPQANKSGKWEVIELGCQYEKLRQFLVSFSQRHDSTLRGFGEMTLEEIIFLTGLSREMAALARQREYDEPFIGGSPETLRLLQEEAARAGLTLLEGSRFHHLTGPNDKGKAVRIVKELYTRLMGEVTTIALGDSHNDLAMLEAVERAYLVQRFDGTYDERVHIPGLNYVDGRGPEGWNQAVLGLKEIKK